MFRLAIALWFIPGLLAQQPDAVALPVVSRLGPVPDSMPVIQLAGNGTMRSGASDFETAVVGQHEVILTVAAETSTATVLAALDHLRGRQIRRVHFLGRLPVGETVGALALGLGDPAATTDLELQLSLERPGVPPECLSPPLQRMLGSADAVGFGQLRMRIVVPPDGTFGNLMGVLAAVASGGSPSVVLTPSKPAAATTGVRPQRFALELGPAPMVRIQASAIPTARPELATSRLGLEAAEGTDDKFGADGGGAGGRYGARRPLVWLERDGLGQQRASGLDWLTREQRPDGGWPGVEGNSDPETTGWVVLSLLSDGQTMTVGQAAPLLARGIGYLIACQDLDGRIASGDGLRIRGHAIATYALAEAYGLSPRRCLLQGAAEAAVRWLGEHDCKDGGWSDDGTGKSDPLVTAHVAMALESARFFGFSVPIDKQGLLACLNEPVLGDTADREIPVAVPAVLFARVFLGGELPVGIAAVLTDRVTVADEPMCYWTSFLMFQVGGRHWTDWSKKLTAMPKARTDGPLAGTWDPPPGMSRAMASALRVLSLQAYYRYTKLVR